MKSRIQFTDRDRTLLKSLYDKTVMSFEQIHRFHFPAKSVSTVSNRLKKLRASGYVQAQKVGTILHHRGEKRIGVIYRLTRHAIQFLQTTYPKEKLRENPVPFNTQTLFHDLLLNELLEGLKNEYPNKNVVHGKLIHYESSKLERVPDAVLIDRETHKKCAIELELTVKSEERYRQIITSYRLSRHYEAVLYFVGNEAIARKLEYTITGFKLRENLPALSTGIFKIKPLETVI